MLHVYIQVLRDYVQCIYYTYLFSTYVMLLLSFTFVVVVLPLFVCVCMCACVGAAPW